MPPLPFEKAILRRIVPSWNETLHFLLSKKIIEKDSIAHIRDEVLKTRDFGNTQFGLTNGLLVISVGCDLNRLLFYLLLYTVNPLHVYDSTFYPPKDCNGKVDVDALNDCPPLGVHNVDYSIRSNEVYRRIFDLGQDGRGSHARIWQKSQLFKDVNIQGALKMRNRLIFVLGYELGEYVSVATGFAHTIKRICRKPGSYPEVESVKIPMVEFLDGNSMSTFRERLYLNGGIFCLPSRILLADILTTKIIPELIGGIIIMNAHRIIDDYNIPFVIRLVRSRNRIAFIKALSDSHSSLRPPGKITFVLKSLFTRDFFLFPRYSTIFEDVLNCSHVQPETFEAVLELSKAAKDIYFAIVRLIQRLLDDLQRNDSTFQDLDMNRIIYSRSTSKLLRSIFENKVLTVNSNYIKRDIESIVNLKYLLDKLLHMDPASFHAYAEQLRSSDPEAPWLFTPDGNLIYKLSTARLFTLSSDTESGIVVDVERHKKADYLREILLNEHVSCEEVGTLFKSAFSWVKSPRVFHNHLRSIRNGIYANLSIHSIRRTLVRKEYKNLHRLCKFLSAGRSLKRRVMILVDNAYMQEYLYALLESNVNNFDEQMFLRYIYQRAECYKFTNMQTDKEFTSFTSYHYHQCVNKSRDETNKLIYNYVRSQIHLLNMNVIRNPFMYINAVDDLSSSDELGETETPRKVDNDSNGIKGFIRFRQSKHFVSNIYVTHVLSYNNRPAALKGILQEKLDSKSESEILAKCPVTDLIYLFQDIKPTLIIVFTPNTHIFRVIEQYCALNFYAKKRNYLRVHVLSYKDCLETHRFKKDLKTELESWGQLQKEKETSVVQLDESVLTRGISVVNGQALIDMRELRSKLPFHLYSNGIQLFPICLDIGDYVLTPDICVERKKLEDLIMSFNNGRLAKQVGEMCSAYEFPFLLIEFENSETFHFPSFTTENKSGLNFLYTKLIILCCNFPKLRLIWGASPGDSANVFIALKKGRGEPDAISNNIQIKDARKSIADKPNEEESATFDTESPVVLRRPEHVKNRDALKILRKIPGVTTHNISLILGKVNSLLHLSELSMKELSSFLPQSDAKSIYEFFNEPITDY
ncbi:conserved hypothetical protein [Theileria equi strain WA]|uniref:ERCC4 domain-containing protein n=1 Tax=Theileria equi strain WA TaxID=1537102 RepID=L1LC78_THEEQ|nr:conserved hypothetical protein [Theileria equi strain WA]EKX72855.1 conserved hypothetical protein [Theileria equi strain WA]|eukprot:XP_004832307.1 conserved hypothetical protein [Theileria equi strain WA]